MCSYLARRGSVYYFRRAIPDELRPAFKGKREFMVSLRTKDRDAAKRLIPEHTMRSDQGLARARAMLSPVPDMPASAPAEPAERLSAAGAAMMRAMEEASQEAAEADHAEHIAQEARQEAREDERAYWRRRMAFSTQQLTPSEAAVKDLLRDKDFEAEVAQDRIAHLRRQLKEARAAGDAGLIGADAPSPTPPIPAQPPVAPDAAGAALDEEVVIGWARERRVAKKGVDAHRAVARWFGERTGKSLVRDITARDVLTFKDKLIAEGQTAANVKVKLSRLRTLLAWAAANQLVESNVAAGVTIRDSDRARNRRREFDLASLNAIIAGPVHAKGERPARGRGEASYWLPLLALFTGARLEELGQLRPQDVASVTYPDADGHDRQAWIIRIREDADDGMTLKNAGSERDVPVHPELERLGFLRYVESQAGQARIFPGLTPTAYGRLTHKWGEWFGLYLRRVIGITDRRLVFHSFRHTFKQYARHAGIEEGVQRQIMGHSSGDVADSYGSGQPTHRLVAGMAAYRVPGLRLPPPAA